MSLAKTTLPIKYDGFYLKRVKEERDNYLSLLKKLKISLSVHDQAEHVFDSLEKVITKYYAGMLISGYKLFSDVMQVINSTVSFEKSTSPVAQGAYLFRTRVGNVDDIKSFEEKDLFHIPFDLREKVTNQRYSISGLPCLYLGESVYSCWVEMKSPPVDLLTSALVRVKKDCFVFDLANMATFYSELNLGKVDHDDPLFIVLPLLLLCSFEVKEKQKPFKPEYIIPQLLMQWLIEEYHRLNTGGKPHEKRIIGIKYFTSAIDVNVSKPYFYTNFAFPVLSTLESGICPRLSDFFAIEKSISGRMLQYCGEAGGNDGTGLTIVSEQELDESVHNDIQLDKHIKVAYSSTLFGRFEDVLQGKMASGNKLFFVTK